MSYAQFDIDQMGTVTAVRTVAGSQTAVIHAILREMRQGQGE
jgi:hypothetical protein